MKRYIIKRIIWLVPIMLVISFITFSLMYLSPGDPVLIYLSQGGDAPNMEAAAELKGKARFECTVSGSIWKMDRKCIAW